MTGTETGTVGDVLLRLPLFYEMKIFRLPKSSVEILTSEEVLFGTTNEHFVINQIDLLAQQDPDSHALTGRVATCTGVVDWDINS